MIDLVAFILAGGKGQRLSALTRYRAKPAVPFAGAYRIIDFTLTNCVKSGISRVFVLTQYISRSLVRHLGIGKPWDLDRREGGLTLLHPRLGYKGADWYKGTADAIYQNISVLEELERGNILILSGDHVYREDYSKFLDFHLESGASATMGVVCVPDELINQCGIATVDSDGNIEKFEEKPERSDSNLASMGIYIFKRKFLISILKRLKKKYEDLDFGKHIIPHLTSNKQLAAYRFEGYWLDIGTIKSYFKASQGLLDPRSGFDFYSNSNILTVPDDNPPMALGKGASVRNSMICGGCFIRGYVSSSILSPEVEVDKGAVVENSIIFHRCRIGAGARIKNTIIDKGSEVGEETSIGYGDKNVVNILQPSYLDSGITLIGRRTIIPAGISVGTNCLLAGSPREAMIDKRDYPDGDYFVSEREEP
ncbi:MAG TPA: glucose-1-phosphate adenylyltransferase family protein [Candidatus Krumholzibacteriaceae bacterium]|nr:glucose-1-phosphate adenylyltransferase family protein [Candidatus Krumholzibacteriaceae bacterium]